MTDRMAITDSLNVFHFEKKPAEGELPYRMQGGAAFDDDASREARRSIRASAKLRSAAQQFCSLCFWSLLSLLLLSALCSLALSALWHSLRSALCVLRSALCALRAALCSLLSALWYQ